MHNQDPNVVDYKVKILNGIDMLWCLPLLRNNVRLLAPSQRLTPKAPTLNQCCSQLLEWNDMQKFKR
jgi:hypothetical protein